MSPAAFVCPLLHMRHRAALDFLIRGSPARPAATTPRRIKSENRELLRRNTAALAPDQGVLAQLEPEVRLRNAELQQSLEARCLTGGY